MVNMTLRKIANNRDITYSPLSSSIPWERSILLHELCECFLIFNKLLKLRSFLDENGKILYIFSRQFFHPTWKCSRFLYWNLFFVVQHRITYISQTVFYTVINNMPRKVKKQPRLALALNSLCLSSIPFFLREGAIVK